MFKTKESTPDITSPETRVPALGGSYVARFGRAGLVASAGEPEADSRAVLPSYTTQFDGGIRSRCRAVDNYTAAFPTASDRESAALRRAGTGGRGCYTDVNL